MFNYYEQMLNNRVHLQELHDTMQSVRRAKSVGSNPGRFGFSVLGSLKSRFSSLVHALIRYGTAGNKPFTKPARRYASSDLGRQ